MATALLVIGGLIAAAGLVGGVWLLIEAFRDHVLQGVFCLVVPAYNLYYSVVRLRSPHKVVILLLAYVCGTVGPALLISGFMTLYTRS